MNKYIPQNFESKWKSKWLEEKLYATPNLNEGENKFYSLYSFPYPSGDGLHVGHVEGMVANDIVARYYRMKGYKVTLPMGWDSFGLPAENFAIKTGIHPNISTEKAISNFIKQINNVGISVDWSKEVAAHRPDYYHWTQWIFLQLFKSGLAYKKNAPVNWCPYDQTVLANEQVIDGKCERCGNTVIQKNMEQWFFKITHYAERLDKDLENVDWPESTKTVQRNWIGKSEGCIVKFKLENFNDVIEVFTTRVDTLYSGTFIVLAPENPILNNIVNNEYKENIDQYIKETKNKTDLERISSDKKEKTGVFTGAFVINPLTNEKMPIWIADFVLAHYGTGAIFGDAHDERDFEFGKKYNIPLKTSVLPLDADENRKKEIVDLKKCYTQEGILFNSEEFNGLNSTKAKLLIAEKLEKQDKGYKKTIFRLRDWLLSRQRYWGCPIPIIYCNECKKQDKGYFSTMPGIYPVEEENLPVILPTDVDFKPTGESPLTRSQEFNKDIKCPECGSQCYREVDTIDTFVDSSWYFFRFCDNKNTKTFASSEEMNKWLPVDLYMIGAEHTVLHLLYSRFFTKFFFDKGYINFNEPFYKMRHMGLILGPDGKKMSKRWGNVINPDDEVNKFGADTVRMYEMFIGPLEEAKPWNDTAENGVFRFLNKLWNLKDKVVKDNINEISLKNQLTELYKLIKKVSYDIETLSFNTSVAKFMEFSNFLNKEDKISKDIFDKFLIILAPFAPFITEELWSNLGNKYSIHLQKWPTFNEDLLKEEILTIAVQINSKVKGTIKVSPSITQEEIINILKKDEKFNKYLTNNLKKVIYIKGKVISIIL